MFSAGARVFSRSRSFFGGAGAGGKKPGVYTNLSLSNILNVF